MVILSQQGPAIAHMPLALCQILLIADQKMPKNFFFITGSF